MATSKGAEPSPETNFRHCSKTSMLEKKNHLILALNRKE